MASKSEYLIPELGVNSMPIYGRFLAHNRHDRVARAFIAADLHSGATRLTRPTLVQAAVLAGVNRTYAFWAAKRQAERAEIEAGLIPLVPANHSIAPKMNGSRLPAVAVDDAFLFNVIATAGTEKVLTIAAAVDAVEQAEQH